MKRNMAHLVKATGKDHGAGIAWRRAGHRPIQALLPNQPIQASLGSKELTGLDNSMRSHASLAVC